MKIEDQVTCDFATGIVTRNSNNKIVGSNHNGYLRFNLNNKHYYTHRIVWYLKYKIWPNKIDHINGIRDDNRLINLRNVTTITNSRNKRKLDANTSGQTGVYKHTTSNKWVAEIKVNQKTIYLGFYATKKEAIAKRKMAEVIYGFHPNHGRN